MSELSQTKEKIFDTFVEMVSTLGYENVTTRDIAKRIGINAASIYYHFESKEKILEFAYSYYLQHQYDNRTPVQEAQNSLETAKADEIVPLLRYSFMSQDQKKYTRMILITKIIYMRIFQDPVAGKMFSESSADSVEYVASILRHGVDIGRISSDFDLTTFATLLVDSMMMMGVKAFARTDYNVGQLEQEEYICAMLTALISTALL
ncbi:MAG: TetR/AcrR family transcriptional regulator [Oscillospiraceae bacterium]|nr:TetR/AcrR family transcriptional regulator [Oscillospiraceae bacterium]